MPIAERVRLIFFQATSGSASARSGIDTQAFFDRRHLFFCEQLTGVWAVEVEGFLFPDDTKTNLPAGSWGRRFEATKFAVQAEVNVQLFAIPVVEKVLAVCVDLHQHATVQRSRPRSETALWRGDL